MEWTSDCAGVASRYPNIPLPALGRGISDRRLRAAEAWKNDRMRRVAQLILLIGVPIALAVVGAAVGSLVSLSTLRLSQGCLRATTNGSWYCVAHGSPWELAAGLFVGVVLGGAFDWWFLSSITTDASGEDGA